MNNAVVYNTVLEPIMFNLITHVMQLMSGWGCVTSVNHNDFYQFRYEYPVKAVKVGFLMNREALAG